MNAEILVELEPKINELSTSFVNEGNQKVQNKIDLREISPKECEVLDEAIDEAGRDRISLLNTFLGQRTKNIDDAINDLMVGLRRRNIDSPYYLTNIFFDSALERRFPDEAKLTEEEIRNEIQNIYVDQRERS